jgi:hypothetical protein
MSNVERFALRRSGIESFVCEICLMIVNGSKTPVCGKNTKAEFNLELLITSNVYKMRWGKWSEFSISI